MVSSKVQNVSSSSPVSPPPTALPAAEERARPTVQPPGSSTGKEEQEFSRDQQLVAAIEQLDLDPIQRAYLLERWMGHVHHLGQSARRAQQRYYALRIIAILGGVAVPALIGLNVNAGDREGFYWLAFGLGLLVAAAVALEEFFRFGERWRHFRRQSELLRGEGWAFLTRSGPAYRQDATDAEAFRTFAGRSEEAIRQEVGDYISQVVRETENPRADGEKPVVPPPKVSNPPKPKAGD